MNAALVEGWNRRVAVDDTVYNLGDLAIGFNALGVSREEMKALVGSLHGRHLLYRGNHDRSRALLNFLGVELVTKSTTIEFGGKRFLLGHFPVPQGYEAEHLDTKGCDFKLHGHVHEAFKRRGRNINVGVDVWGFQPVSMEEVLSIVESA
jgi:calcineurin-like phosphoesterase family protein